jgi:hypothetical protein
MFALIVSDGVLDKSGYERLCKRNQVKEMLCFGCGEKISGGRWSAYE